MTEITEQPHEVRSSVKITTNAKGLAQLSVSAYEGVTEDEMQRLKDIAIRVYEIGQRELGQRANFQ